MQRKQHTFHIQGIEMIVGDLLWGDLLLLTEDFESGFWKILLEFNTSVPTLSSHEAQHILGVISWGDDGKKGKPQKLEELIMMETFVMVHSHQSLQEIRNWSVQYFFLVSRCIGVALGHKKADEVLNPDGVDRDGVRDLTGGKKEVMM